MKREGFALEFIFGFLVCSCGYVLLREASCQIQKIIVAIYMPAITAGLIFFYLLIRFSLSNFKVLTPYFANEDFYSFSFILTHSRLSFLSSKATFLHFKYHCIFFLLILNLYYFLHKKYLEQN